MRHGEACVLHFHEQENSNFELGVVGSDLSLFYTFPPGAHTSDVWILKDCRYWTELFTIKFPQRAELYRFPSPNYIFFMHFHHSNKGDFLLVYALYIMIFDCWTRKLEHNADSRSEVYLESLVNPQINIWPGTSLADDLEEFFLVCSFCTSFLSKYRLRHWISLFFADKVTKHLNMCESIQQIVFSSSSCKHFSFFIGLVSGYMHCTYFSIVHN